MNHRYTGLILLIVLLLLALCIFAGCSDTLTTLTDQYGRKLTVLHTQTFLQGPILVDVGQFDEKGHWQPIAQGAGESLLQSILRGGANGALSSALLRPDTVNNNTTVSGTGGGFGTGPATSGTPGGTGIGGSTSGGAVNINANPTNSNTNTNRVRGGNSNAQGGQAQGGQGGTSRSVANPTLTSSPTVTSNPSATANPSTNPSSTINVQTGGTGTGDCQGNCGGNTGNGNQ